MSWFNLFGRVDTSKFDSAFYSLNDTVNNLRKELDDTKSKLIETECELKATQNKLETVEVKYKQLYDSITHESRSAPVCIDFDTLKPFSIERLVLQGHVVPTTILGYFMDTNTDQDGVKLKEWFINCSDEIHEQLVEQFDNWIMSKSK